MTNKEYLQAAAGSNRDQWLCADAWAADEMGIPEQLHHPSVYIIQIANNKGLGPGSSISDVDVGDSLANRVASNFNQNASITITCTFSGVSYRQFLANSEAQPFTVGKTMIISTSAGQLDQSVAVTHRNTSGDRKDHVITPTLDPYQTQTDRIIDEYEYMFDGMTRLRFNQINSGTVTVRLYLKNKFAATQIIADRPAKQTYLPPKIINALP